MASNPFPPTQAARYTDLSALIQTPESSSTAAAGGEAAAARTFPSEDTIAALLHARARAELPYTRVSPSGTDYIVVNPLRVLSGLNDESSKGYAEDVARTDGGIGGDPRQPSVYELAGRVWLLMSRQRETQTVIYEGLTGAGKSTTSRHLTTQILKLAATSKAQRRLADQVSHLLTLLESFGNSKTLINPSASQHGRYFELHFSPEGTLAGAKVLPFGLNKWRIGPLEQEERTFHVFYQLLAGASPDEREQLRLDDPDTYALLASSNCYRLPGGPFSDDSTQLGELRAAFASLGFKMKHVRSIFSVLTAILVLSNITFTDTRATGSLGMTSYEEHTTVVERHLLVEVATHLGVSAEELEAVLVNRTKWVRHDLASVFLDAEGAASQRDSLMRDLYGILFAFVVEMANKRLAPPPSAETLQIVQLDVPGHQSRTLTTEPNQRNSTLLTSAPLINANGQNGFDEFSVNFQNEILHSYLLRRTFEDNLGWNAEISADGIKLPQVPTMDNAACVELLRGGLLGSEKLAKHPLGVIGVLAEVGENIKGEDREEVKADAVVRSLTSTFTGHPSFIARPPTTLGPMPKEGRMFGINHYCGPVAYDATDFIDHNADVFDKQLVGLLRSSTDSFVTKLVSGPALATEGHPLDDNIVVEAQVSVSPLRTPTPIAHPIEDLAPQASVAWPIDDSVPQPVSAQINATLATLFDTIDLTRVWGVHCIRPNDSGHANSYDRRRLKSQVRSLLLPDLVNRRQVDYVADYTLHQFCIRHSLPAQDVHRTVEDFARQHGWFPGTDYAIGNDRVWLAWGPWREQEDLLRSTESRHGSGEETLTDTEEKGALTPRGASSYGHGIYGKGEHYPESQDNLLRTHSRGSYGYADSPDPGASDLWLASRSGHDHGGVGGGAGGGGGGGGGGNRGVGGYDEHDPSNNNGPGAFIQTEKRHHATEVIATTAQRRWWIRIVWLLTWWIPSFLLKWPGGMKRADVRMAWREKVAICIMIGFTCGVVIFYIIGFGKILCPDMDKAWNSGELLAYTGDNGAPYYAAIAGKVYDFSNFWKQDHTNGFGTPTNEAIMAQFGGQNLNPYFPVPLFAAPGCKELSNNPQLQLIPANISLVSLPQAVHSSGALGASNSYPGSDFASNDWYWSSLLPALDKRYKGTYVIDNKDIQSAISNDATTYWSIYKGKIFDLSDYFNTISKNSGVSGTNLPNWAFLDKSITDLFKQGQGSDISKALDEALAAMNADDAKNNLDCLNSAFYIGGTDFRKTARCLVQNYMLLAFSVILMTTIVAKFLAALQLGGKRNPELLDKFVVCQVPCYTEGEESLKKTIDSLACLEYDDKRKLIFIICDGNIIGSGNNRPTPRIVLDILGVDPKVDPEPLLFKSIGEGSKQLNYGKVYSGLYEVEGHVVPYVVVVKVGKPTETSRPGNRGKRDSQVLLMQYLNRVHFDAPMCPLELEIYHQMRNVIGIDPTFYEYIFQVDADTTVAPESLNRLISCTADDQKIIGICGETKVANERESFTTMIQVYEYYISHHLTKAFESLFGSVTCLPGCFSVYRIRTADKGRPVIISSVVIDEYAEPNVDTLHKKNLFSLGEDRYLTTLMMKHFPTFKMKFTPDALAYTVAPSRWNVLLSQRRRWINSTIHNLVELLFLPEMCGFCFFSMRFIVFIDLLGTIILPATFTYLVYLIVVVSTHKAPIPYISIGMIAAVYGLQAVIFILKREFMLVGWMFVYILAYPVYSVFLPLYSFWSMDDFSWGNTRKVVGEGSNKTVVYDDDERFDDSMIPLRTFKEYEANAWETASLHSDGEKEARSDSGRTGRTRRTRNTNYAGSMHSSARNSEYRDHSGGSSRVHSPAPYMNPQSRMPSMWGGGGAGSMYGEPFTPPMAFGPNPFNSPAMSLESLRPPTGGMFPPYAPSPLAGPPRNTMVSAGFGMDPARASNYSLATTANPFGAPTLSVNPNPSPSDEAVLSVLRSYLLTQDLMTVTKRSAREAIYGLFPNANLQERASWLNENIDKILSE
ncbi:Chitin synthase 6 [Vanrija pseudolonga]|uniref:chitin synthase n=1 Tax=Vanrija pseudolonga TaxID=143232 RepID=A0AAF0Y245_9TREE|nr:Chitin synthase 6 [Vanrija pseudolonga]